MEETYCEECTEHTDHDGEEENQKQAESGALVARSLGVHDCEGKRSVAADDGCQVVDAVKDGNSVEEGC